MISLYALGKIIPRTENLKKLFEVLEIDKNQINLDNLLEQKDL